MWPVRPRADLLVGRVRREAARVADRGRVDAVGLPEDALRAPEAAHPDDELLHPVGERRLRAACRAPRAARGPASARRARAAPPRPSPRACSSGTGTWSQLTHGAQARAPPRRALRRPIPRPPSRPSSGSSPSLRFVQIAKPTRMQRRRGPEDDVDGRVQLLQRRAELVVADPVDRRPRDAAGRVEDEEARPVHPVRRRRGMPRTCAGSRRSAPRTRPCRRGAGRARSRSSAGARARWILWP